MDDGEPFSLFLDINFYQHWEFWIGLVIFLVLLVFSGLISSSEVAFFALEPDEKQQLKENKSNSDEVVQYFLEKPKSLLAIILILNNFVNVGIVIISSYLFEFIYPNTPEVNDIMRLILEIGVITFFILLFGEIMPKIYANRNSLSVAQFMAKPLYKFSFLPPFSWLKNFLVNGSAFILKSAKKRAINVSTDDLENAIALTRDDNDDDKILEGIVNFGNTDVKQIMTARTDAVALDVEKDFNEVVELIVESGFSRIPVYKDNFDEVEGILFVKDLLPYIDGETDFNWRDLIRKPFFVPENKKIDDLLKEFQERKMHMAIVVDEYGGASGLVTLEDVLEEIVGEITDEFDEDDIIYSKIDDKNFIFEGKTPLVDVYKVLDIDGKPFEEVKGESDSLAGFLIEHSGKIMRKNEMITFEDIKFIVEASDKKRIKMIKIILP